MRNTFDHGVLNASAGTKNPFHTHQLILSFIDFFSLTITNVAVLSIKECNIDLNFNLGNEKNISFFPRRNKLELKRPILREKSRDPLTSIRELRKTWIKTI